MGRLNMAAEEVPSCYSSEPARDIWCRDSTSRLTSNSRASRVPAEMFMGTRVIMGYIRLYVDSLFYAYKIVKNDSPDYPNC